MENFEELFIQESLEMLEELEASLMELEENPEDENLIAKVFRIMHTLKGSSAMFGFDAISEFTHKIEDVYDRLRSGKMRLTSHLIDLSLAACDQIKLMLSDKSLGISDVRIAKILDDFQLLAEGKRKLLPTENESKPYISLTKKQSKKSDLSSERIYRIRFKPNQDITRRGVNVSFIIQELTDLGTSTVVAHTFDIPNLEEINPELIYVSWDIIITTNKTEEAIRDVFIFVEEDSVIDISIIDEVDMDDDSEFECKRIGQILIERGDIEPEELNRLFKDRKLIGQVMVERGLAHPDMVESAFAEQEHIRKTNQKKRQVAAKASIRVSAEKLDRLVDLVGELVTLQSKLTQFAISKGSDDLLRIAEEVERLAWDMRDNTMGLRMVPIGTLFSKFKRLVRELSSDIGKKVVLEMSGEDTELDKNVIELLNDPLVHIIRNSIDHGIEPPGERKARGKSEYGTISLSAKYSGADVIISISDDGKGIDIEKIRKKAEEKGLLTRGQDYTDKEILDCIFSPGFSTSENVSKISGRGVGMDVVKRNIESLRGNIEIDTQIGKGTTIILRLPLTLAIIDGLLIKTGDSTFVIPLPYILECVQVSTHDLSIFSADVIDIRGEAIPFIRLRDRFSIHGRTPDVEMMVVVEENGKKLGIIVDSVIGEHQTVIKNLGGAYEKIPDISGVTILGNGDIALILDVSALMSVDVLKTKGGV